MTARTIAASILALVTASTVDAQSRVEAWGAFSSAMTAPAGTLVSSYEPPLVFGTALASSAGQTLTIDADRGPGFQAGINLFTAPHFGLQVLVDRVATNLSGVNGAYSSSLTWVSRQPPDYVPRNLSTSYSTPWPDTTGTLDQLTLGFNGVARTKRAGRLWATVSGGVAWVRLSGRAQPLGYTEYHLGGHSTLFYEEMHLASDLGPASRFGWNAGAEINVALGRRVALLAGYRFVDAGTIDVAVRPAEIVNQDQIAFSNTIENITTGMHLPPAHISTSSSRIIVGLKVTR